jgi:hypothetical protein
MNAMNIGDGDGSPSKYSESPILRVIRDANPNINTRIAGSYQSKNEAYGNGAFANLTDADPTLDVTNSQKILTHQSFTEQQKSYASMQFPP